MNGETVKNWIRRAENDLKIGKDELITDEPATDMICFHMQQCAVEIRYGEAFYYPSMGETKKSIKIAEKVKDFILKKLKEARFKV